MSDTHAQAQDEHAHDDHDHALISEKLPAGDWKVDPETSAVNFRTRALLGILPVSGVFESFSGALHVDESGAASGHLTIDTEKLDTGVAKRDEHLRTADFFHAAEHPHMTFAVDSVQPSGGDHLNLKGTLQIRDKSIAIELPVHATAHGDHLHIEGRSEIDHHGAGLGWAKPGMVAKKVKAQVSLTLQKA